MHKLPAKQALKRSAVSRASAHGAVLLLLLMVITTPALHAQTPGEDAQRRAAMGWSVGVAALLRDTAYVDADNDVLVVPLVQYQGEQLYLRGLRLGWRSYEQEGTRVDLIAQARMDSIKASDLQSFDALRSRQRSIDVGVALEQDLGPLQLNFSVLGDLLGRSKGQELELALSYPKRFGRTLIAPGIGARWWSSRLANYYYGLDQIESPVNIAYRPGSALLGEIGVSVFHPLGEHWALASSLRYRYLLSELRDSPLVDERSELALLIGLSRAL